MSVVSEATVSKIELSEDNDLSDWLAKPNKWTFVQLSVLHYYRLFYSINTLFEYHTYSFICVHINNLYITCVVYVIDTVQFFLAKCPLTTVGSRFSADKLQIVRGEASRLRNVRIPKYLGPQYCFDIIGS